ncbi:hypothetical protein LTR36_007448 [Oleoguttula mirabilis]|uniref:Uncharacterized protein n=1 Tax=Oleoguttula mirabilis TaxID=1507867 RepID=A0AAV9J9G5_9PEZI|nr:hypothetical protein LTR36_007448 [Oleoguttula mirabilis]
MQRIYVHKLPKTRKERAERRDCARQHATLYRQQVAFKPRCSALLSKIPSNFVTAGNTPGIVAIGNEFEGDLAPWSRLNGDRPWGIDRLARSLGYERWCVDRKRNDASPYVIIMKAVIQASYRISGLDLGHLEAGVPPRLFKLPTDSGMAYLSLKTLRLTLSPELGYLGASGYQPDHWNFNKKVEDLTQLFHFLAAAENLETLSLTIDSLSIPQGFHQLTFKVLAGHLFGVLVPRLRELELVGHHVTLEDLRNFIKVRKETLRSVKLTRVREYGADYQPWLSVILAHLGQTRDRRQVEIVDSYNGDAWVSDYARRSGLYPAADA